VTLLETCVRSSSVDTTDRMVAVLPHGHPLVNAKSIRLVDLLASPMVLMDRDSSVRRIVDAACASIGRLAEPARSPQPVTRADRRHAPSSACGRGSG